MTKEEIMNALSLLGEKLYNNGTTGELLLTGGAAMCIVHSARDMTKDVDALYEPKGDINKYAKEVADEKDLPEDWLNDSVKGFMTPNAPIQKVTELKGLIINTVPLEYLLAMKLMASRYGEKDAADINFLMKKLNITTAEQAFSIISEYMPHERILPKTMYVMEEYMDQFTKEQENKELGVLKGIKYCSEKRVEVTSGNTSDVQNNESEMEKE